MVPIYIYRDPGNTVFTAATEAAIGHCFGSIANLQSMFGGYAQFGRLAQGERFYGVYGNRNCSRFRRLLAESGLPLRIVLAPPPERLTSITTLGPRPTAGQRAELERRLKMSRAANQAIS